MENYVSNRDRLLKSNEAGNFLEAIYACALADHGNRSLLALELANLHNEGLINIIQAFASLKNESPKGHIFFLILHVFEKTLPSLDAQVPAVMQCVLQLHKEAGGDLTAYAVIDSYIEFCVKAPFRPIEALKAIMAKPKKFADLLPATLIAGSRVDYLLYLRKSIRFCKSKNIELRRRAAFSVGKLILPKGFSRFGAILDALEFAADCEADDCLLSGVIKSTFSILNRDKSQELRSIELINSALGKGGDYALHAASEIFGFHTDELPPALLDTLLVHLVRVKPTNKGTLDIVDHGISRLLKKGDPEKAIQFLEDLLVAHPGEQVMASFDSTGTEILSNKAIISKVLTRWFLRGDQVLHEGIHKIIGLHCGNELPMEIDSAELKPADFRHILFVAQKAIGYLFNQPISAVSVLISLMRNTQEPEVLTELGALLFHPLLINYTGKVKDYVLRQSDLETGKVKETIDQSLDRVDKYLEDLRSIGNLPALHPSESQREAHHRHFSLLIAESWKAAEAQSAILNLASKCVLLYGRKSINYVHGPDGKSHRMETPLQSHGTEMEFPRMETLDPFGLDYLLRIFRAKPL